MNNTPALFTTISKTIANTQYCTANKAKSIYSTTTPVSNICKPIMYPLAYLDSIYNATH